MHLSNVFSFVVYFLTIHDHLVVLQSVSMQDCKRLRVYVSEFRTIGTEFLFI